MAYNNNISEYIMVTVMYKSNGSFIKWWRYIRILGKHSLFSRHLNEAYMKLALYASHSLRCMVK